jgi:hypothetical protein
LNSPRQVSNVALMLETRSIVRKSCETTESSLAEKFSTTFNASMTKPLAFLPVSTRSLFANCQINLAPLFSTLHTASESRCCWRNGMFLHLVSRSSPRGSFFPARGEELSRESYGSNRVSCLHIPGDPRTKFRFVPFGAPSHTFASIA